MRPERDVDVLVVGSGAAGLSAAVSAHEQGAARVLVAEGSGTVGGSSRLAAGAIMASGSAHQQKAGIEDDVDGFFHDYLQLNQWDVEPGPVSRFLRETGATIDWLVEQGVAFHDELIHGGDEVAPRAHLVVGGGQGLIDALHSQCVQRGIDVALGRRVDRLVTEGDVVVGVAAGDDELRASATVVATGGFGANPDKLRSFFPAAWHEGWTWYVGADTSQGDAIDLGAAVDAQIVGRGNGLRSPEPRFLPRNNEAFLPGWMVLVDRDARRFVNETGPYGVIDHRIRARGDVAYAVFDDAAIHPPPDLVEFYRSSYKENFPGRPPIRPRNWQASVIEEMAAAARIHTAATIPALAEQVGLDPTTLAGTVDRYNTGVAAGRDDDHLKPSRFLAAIATPPYYAALLRPAVVQVTATGLRIDADGRVLHRHGHAIEGLYAAGECTGGIVGPVYVGSGNSLANCTTFGRIAGQSAGRAAVALLGSRVTS